MNSQVLFKALFLSACLSLLPGCAKPAPDEWYAPTGETEPAELTWTPVSENNIVLPSNTAAAIARLRDVDAIELKNDELSVLAGMVIPVPQGTHAILVRGLTFMPHPGGFSIFEKNGNVLVANESMGTKEVAMVKSPVILLLTFIPKKVYVSCAMDS